ncbi:MAG: hypothetical protein NUV48_07125 [Peptococcaceae bacterium]|nr:hypothetical protein [Peptococcaceae bacterium]
MEKPYWFRLNEKIPDDLKKYLESLSGKERSNYIRTAILWYWCFGERLASIEQKLDRALEGASSIPAPLPEMAKNDLEIDDSYLEEAAMAIINGKMFTGR